MAVSEQTAKIEEKLEDLPLRKQSADWTLQPGKPKKKPLTQMQEI